MLYQLVWWHTWKEQNERIFRGISSTPVQVMHRIKGDLDLWVAAKKDKIFKLIHSSLEPD